jgi:hypothetical protein
MYHFDAEAGAFPFQKKVAQRIAQTSTKICTLSFLLIRFNKFPNKFAILVGGVKLRVICTRGHTVIAKGQLLFLVLY